ncbi:hypothetical protein AXF42_Ash004963 [Apostasia shenzhenica]|uniref:Uncharacterized protein n=1 Tax=Apostasia shenzhenica TaxID=1088818 RepID=A0A2I0B829_9ASPA|nr:hypothetical protein AXF42_Ash004963 [Apostasia shenzhenica]
MTIQDHLPETSMTMFPSCACRCQRATTAQFSMAHTSSSYANQGLACSSHHGPLNEMPRSRSKLSFHYFRLLRWPTAMGPPVWTQQLNIPFSSGKLGLSSTISYL